MANLILAELKLAAAKEKGSSWFWLVTTIDGLRIRVLRIDIEKRWEMRGPEKQEEESDEDAKPESDLDSV